MTTVLGIDEAGKGPVIGPLVIAGAMIEKDREDELRKIGVKDSKLLTLKQREDLYEKLKHVLKDYIILKISAREIDELRENSNLNKIEAEKFGNIIKTLNPDIAIVDAPQVSTEKFADYVRATAQNKTKIISENKADLNHVIVAAASILAKVERDWEINKIKEECGYDFGVGYPHDENTIRFLEEILEKEGKFPEFVRKSWSTAENMIKKKQQKGLNDF